jgi:quinohemoprotein ethanol dehydrogenase
MNAARRPTTTLLLLVAAMAIGHAAVEPHATSSAAASSRAAAVDAARLRDANAEPHNWMSHGRDYTEQRFSPLAAINADTIQRLGLAWYYEANTERGQHATPIVVDGVMYVTHAWSTVSALDARTGRLLWHYDPKVPGESAHKACCDVVNRGVAVWQGRVYVGTLDGRLIAIDAATGERVWETLTVDRELPYTITGAPRVVNDMVIIGNGGAEFGVRGYVSAYDAASGEQRWRFHTVPGNPADGFENDAMALSARTWTGEWWRLGGGGTVWDSIVYDPALDLLYIGVGNGTPWNHALRSPGGGDNLFLSSIVALRAATGEYVWHYQTTPGESWDFTATQPMILAELEIDGETRRVLMQAPKNGFFYVLDRATGELLSARNFVDVNWATGIDHATGRPIERPEARYGDTGEPFLGTPGPLGAHNWQPMAFSPQTGLAYFPAMITRFTYVPEDTLEISETGWNTGVDFTGRATSAPAPRNPRTGIDPPQGYLLAWDPVAQREAWRVQRDGPWHGGALATAGNLVFQGTGQGYFTAQRADTGDALWSFYAQGGILAGPISYAIDGEQYVAVSVGWGGAFAFSGETARRFAPEHNRPRVLAFKLDGEVTLPPPTPLLRPRTLQPPSEHMPDDIIEAGWEHYHRACAQCHGRNAVAGTIAPDLRYAPTLGDSGVWRTIVHDGALTHRGMIGFGFALSHDDVEAVRAYVVRQAQQAARTD